MKVTVTLKSGPKTAAAVAAVPAGTGLLYLADGASAGILITLAVGVGYGHLLAALGRKER